MLIPQVPPVFRCILRLTEHSPSPLLPALQTSAGGGGQAAAGSQGSPLRDKHCDAQVSPQEPILEEG